MERQLIYELEKLILLGNHLQIHATFVKLPITFFFFCRNRKTCPESHGTSIVKVILKAWAGGLHFEIFKLQSSVVESEQCDTRIGNTGEPAEQDQVAGTNLHMQGELTFGKDAERVRR